MGDSIFGKYRLIAELGHGGMADVFLAVQAGPLGSGFRKLTVVKRLRQNLAEEPEFVAMLVDEARIAARLNHPNVVQTNEVGQVGPHYFIAMEYLDGQPLHRIQHRALQREKKGEAPLVTKEMQYVILMDCLAGLHHAHELCDFDGTHLQIVHRDMTPHNIFVTYAGQVKVVDFGIAKAAGRASETRQGVVKGKVRYMAPEQAVGQNIDRRVDIFSVGVMLWEAATGRRMWKDMDDLHIVQMLLTGKTPTSPRAVDPSVPAPLDAICQKALAHNADDRYATAEDFRTDLEQYLAEEKVLVDARRKLTAALGTMFADKRTEIKAIIEQQLALVDAKASSEVEAIALSPDSRSASTSADYARAHPAAAATSPPSSERNERSGETNTSFTDAAATGLYTGPRSGLQKKLVAAFAVAAVAATVAIAVLLSRKPSANASASANIDTPTAATEIILRLNATPASAHVSIDDGPKRSVPVDARVAKDDREHTVRIEAEGYSPRLEVVRFTSDIALTFDLRPSDSKIASSNAANAKKIAPVHAGAPLTLAKTPTTATSTVKSAEPPPPPPAITHTAATADPPKQGGGKQREVDKTDPWAK